MIDPAGGDPHGRMGNASLLNATHGKIFVEFYGNAIRGHAMRRARIALTTAATWVW
jgi:hypothetical protein